MDFIIVFFRDVLSGIVYYLYVGLCIFAFFYVFGFVANRKRNAINDKLKEKKQYDIASGREAAIAAMESKQVLSVDEEENNPNATLAAAANSAANDVKDDLNKKEEVPAVMVINSDDSSNTSTSAPQQEAEEGPKVEAPLVIDTSSVQ